MDDQHAISKMHLYPTINLTLIIHEPPHPSNQPCLQLVVLLSIAISISDNSFGSFDGLSHFARDGGLHTFCSLVGDAACGLLNDRCRLFDASDAN